MDVVQEILTRLLVVAAGGLIFACFVLRYGAAVLRLTERALRGFAALPFVAKVVLPAFLGVAILYGGSKTNAPPAQLLRSLPRMMRTVSDADIARGWQVWNTRTNDVPEPMPALAVVNADWHQFGGHSMFDFVRFDDGWTFPFGTQVLSRITVMEDGALRTKLFITNDEIRVAGCQLAAIPCQSQFWMTTNGASRLFSWSGFVPCSAQVELFPNGDFVVRSNAVRTLCRRIEPFDYDGDGIPNGRDSRPWFYDGDHYGQSDERRQEVDAAVGFGLANGLYKLTAAFPAGVVRRTHLRVGDEDIVVDEPGEYSFLLKKGLEYTFDIDPFDGRVTFDAVDDVRPPILFGMFSSSMEESSTGWTSDGEWLRLESPRPNCAGRVCWMPQFCAEPPLRHQGPNDPPQVVFASCHDLADDVDVKYHWRSTSSNIVFGSAESNETTLTMLNMPSWDVASIEVVASFGTNELKSSSYCTYGLHPAPQAGVCIRCPDAFVINEGGLASGGLVPVVFEFSSDVVTSGVVRLSFDPTGLHGVLWESQDKTGSVDGEWSHEVIQSDGFSKTFYFESSSASSFYRQGVLSASWESYDCKTSTVERCVTVVAARCEPICNLFVAASGAGRAVYNPCSVANGSASMRFRVEMTPADFPDELISWTTTLAGVAFDGGNLGREVCVTNNGSVGENVKGELSVSIGADQMQGPTIPLSTEESVKVVELCAHVVTDEHSGSCPISKSGIERLVEGVNEIFSQVGVRFTLNTNIVHIVNEKWREIKIGSSEQHDLACSFQWTCGLPICFVGKLVAEHESRKILSCFSDGHVLVVDEVVTPQILAHELGHAAGLTDVYYDDAECNLLEVVSGKDDVPGDWSSQGNIGFYAHGLLQRDIIRRLLMCGYAGDDHVDIPQGKVKGYEHVMRWESLSDPAPKMAAHLMMLSVGKDDMNFKFNGGDADEDEIPDIE